MIAQERESATPKDRHDREEELAPTATVRMAGLRYVSDSRPGIRRRRAGRGFRYMGPDGAPVTDTRTLARIKALGIPPAWQDVWISADPRGHLQATGRDAKGRKQYLYHQRWREVRDETKYGRLALFGSTLPRIRERTARDLAKPGLPREKVLATIVQLLDLTLIRVGNEEYARANETYGLTTLRQQQVQVEGTHVHFEFRGKSGKEHVIDVRNRKLARIVKRCEELPGYELFQYIDEQGERRSVDSADVNEYLEEITGQHFTAKDFRTWGGSVIAARALRELGAADTETQTKKNVVEAVRRTARELGNTPAVCRRSYIHPDILIAYTEGRLDEPNAVEGAPDAVTLPDESGLRPAEKALLRLLTRNMRA